MWDQKVRRLTEESFKRRPQSPLRRSRARFQQGRTTAEAVRREPTNYTGIGAELKAERERQGRNLTDAAAALRIQQQHLEAIEAGRFDDLPGAAYVSGFLRTYGRYLGADPEDVVAAFREESTLPLGPTKLVVPEPIAEPKRPRGTVVLVSLLAVVVLYAGWAYLTEDSGEVGEAVAPAPERLVGLLQAESPAGEPARPGVGSEVEVGAPAPDPEASENDAPQRSAMATSDAAAATAREAQRDADAVLDWAGSALPAPPVPAPPRVELPTVAPSETATSTQAPSGDEPRRPADAGEDTPPETPPLDIPELAPSAPSVPQPPPVVSGEATALPPPPPSVGSGEGYVPQRFGGGDTDARVVVRAKADSWVQIQGGRNETLLTRILRPGDTFYAPDRGDLMLTTGNVGGLEIIVDGEPLGPLGPMGAVRRNISLDAERLLARAGAREPRR